nr:unnamed protein product [Digitaria exilis]
MVDLSVRPLIIMANAGGATWRSTVHGEGQARKVMLMDRGYRAESWVARMVHGRARVHGEDGVGQVKKDGDGERVKELEGAVALEGGRIRIYTEGLTRVSRGFPQNHHGGRFERFGPQNRGFITACGVGWKGFGGLATKPPRQRLFRPLRTRGIIAKLVSRRSEVVKTPALGERSSTREKCSWPQARGTACRLARQQARRSVERSAHRGQGVRLGSWARSLGIARSQPTLKQQLDASSVRSAQQPCTRQPQASCVSRSASRPVQQADEEHGEVSRLPDDNTSTYMYELNSRSNLPMHTHADSTGTRVGTGLALTAHCGGQPIPGVTDAKALLLNYNHLSGPLPANLGLSKLSYLAVANNKLTGPIPSSIEHLQDSLFELLLLNNHLSGCLPHELGMLHKATVIDAGMNQLTGPIPASFSCLSSVEQLNLASNLLYGQVPDALCKLTGPAGRLANLTLSGNYFTSVGPACAALIKDGAMDVKNNCIPGLANQRRLAECAAFQSQQPKTCPAASTPVTCPAAAATSAVAPGERKAAREYSYSSYVTRVGMQVETEWRDGENSRRNIGPMPYATSIRDFLNDRGRGRHLGSPAGLGNKLSGNRVYDEHWFPAPDGTRFRYVANLSLSVCHAAGAHCSGPTWRHSCNSNAPGYHYKRIEHSSLSGCLKTRAVPHPTPPLPSPLLSSFLLLLPPLFFSSLVPVPLPLLFFLCHERGRFGNLYRLGTFRRMKRRSYGDKLWDPGADKHTVGSSGGFQLGPMARLAAAG